MTTRRVDGNSIPSGAGITPPGFVALLSSAVGHTFTNGGVPGAMFPDITPDVYSHTASPEDIIALILGTNESWYWGAGATQLGWTRDGLGALLGYCATPNKILAKDCDCVGSWNDTYAYGLGKNSNQHGDTLSCEVTGDVVYIAFIRQLIASGECKVWIDGEDVADVSSAAPGFTTRLYNDPTASQYHQWPGSLGPMLLRVKLPKWDTYPVQIQVTSEDDGNRYVYPDWIAGNDQPDSPRVVLANTPRMNATGYTTLSSSPANVFAYACMQRDLVSVLRGDGLNVRLADLYSIVNTLQSDGIHPDQAAQWPIALGLTRGFLEE